MKKEVQPKSIDEWLKQDSKFIKIKIGDRYECIFHEMNFDATGGFQGKPTVKYMLEDLEDGQT